MQSQKPYEVLAPGPVNLHPRVREVLGLPMIHHRTPEFDAILKSTLERLPKIFQTKQPCFTLSSTGSGGMEAALVNVLEPGDEVLAIVSGKFGERWRDMAKVYGGRVTALEVEWGESVDPGEVRTALRMNPSIKIVLCQACETSTGVAHPIREIARIIRETSEALLLVDAITALGAYDLPMDDWGLDAVVGGSQKAFMCPTGMSLVAFSERAWKKINRNPAPRFYFDVREERRANARGETWLSSNVPLIRALGIVTDLMLDPSLEHFFSTIARRQKFVARFFPELRCEPFAKSPSPSVTALSFTGVDTQRVRLALEKKHRVTLMGGQEHLKGRIIRIGHMGYIEPEVMTELFFQLRDVLSDLGHSVEVDEPRLRAEMEKFWQPDVPS